MANEAHKEPTMEEILASIRKIISDDDITPAPEASAPASVEPVITMNDDAVEEMKFEPTDGELDDSMFEDSPEPAGFDAQEEADPFGDSEFVVKDNSQDLDDFEPLGTLDDELTLETSEEISPAYAETPEAEPEIVEAVAAEEADAAEDASFEEMLGAVNKVAEDYDAVSGDLEDEIETEVAEAIIAQPEPQPEHTEATMSATSPAPSAGLTDDSTAGAAAGALGKLFSTIELNSENTIEGLVREMLKPMIKEWLDANLASIVERKVEAEVQRIASMAR